MGSDANTTLSELRSLVEQFVAERDWHQFHDPKNLAMSIAIEAAELMEHFQWLRSDQLDAVVDDRDMRQAIREEIADVLAYLLAMANRLDLDLSSALVEKFEKNARKYPAEEFRGRSH
jgi:dCTP diphosphatase